MTNWKLILIATIILFGFSLFVFLFHNHSIGISPDSVDYLSTAQNIALGKGAILFNGKPFVLFPLGYPAFLASVHLLFGDIMVAASCVNGFLFTSNIFLFLLILSPKGHIKLVASWVSGLFFIVLSPSLLEVYTMLWSETVFLPLSLVALLLLQKQAYKGSNIKMLLLILVLSFVCLVRFVGVTLVFASYGCILTQWGGNWWEKVKQILGVSLSLAPLAVNLFYNKASGASFTGGRLPSTTPFWGNVHLVGDVLAKWACLPLEGWPLSFILFALLFVFLVWSIIKGLLRKERRSCPPPNVCAFFSLTYLCFILFTATVSKYEPINNRILSPLYLPLLITLCIELGGIYTKYHSFFRAWYAKTLFVGCVFALFCFQSFAFYPLYTELLENGIPGYTEEDWKEDAAVVYLRKIKFDKPTTLFCNAPEALYFFCHQPSSPLPETLREEEILGYQSNKTPHLLVWFSNELDNPDIFRLEKIKTLRQLSLVERPNNEVSVFFVK